MGKCKICGIWLSGNWDSCYTCRERLKKDKKFRYNKLYRGKF